VDLWTQNKRKIHVETGRLLPTDTGKNLLRREQQPFVNILHATLRNYCVFNQRLTFYGQVTTFFETYRILLESEREEVVIVAVILCVYTLVTCVDPLMSTNRRVDFNLPDHLFTGQVDSLLSVGWRTAVKGTSIKRIHADRMHNHTHIQPILNNFYSSIDDERDV
jgi:hypothetical protein